MWKSLGTLSKYLHGTHSLEGNCRAKGMHTTKCWLRCQTALPFSVGWKTTSSSSGRQGPLCQSNRQSDISSEDTFFDWWVGWKIFHVFWPLIFVLPWTACFSIFLLGGLSCGNCGNFLYTMAYHIMIMLNKPILFQLLNMEVFLPLHHPFIDKQNLLNTRSYTALNAG